MGYGSEALACYTGRTMITSADMNSMAYCRSVMQTVFHMVYPDLEEYRFDEWYAANSRLGASVYQMN